MSSRRIGRLNNRTWVDMCFVMDPSDKEEMAHRTRLISAGPQEDTQLLPVDIDICKDITFLSNWPEFGKDNLASLRSCQFMQEVFFDNQR